MAKVYIQRYDGEWVDVTDGQLLACCDCGLVHDTEYAILDGRILKRAIRDKRETSYRRMQNNVMASINTLKGKIMLGHTRKERKKKSKSRKRGKRK